MAPALIKRICYLLATVITVAIVFLSSYLLQGLWLLTAAILLVNITFESTLLRRTLVILLTGVAAAFCIFIGTLLAPVVPAQILFVVLVTVACAYAGVKSGRARYPWLVINLLALLSMNGQVSWPAALDHAGAVLVGMSIVLVMQMILLPFYSRDEYRYSRQRVLRHLGKLLMDILNCLDAPEYPDNVYLFERRVHKQKIKCLEYLAILTRRESVIASSVSVSQDLQALFEVIIDVGQARRRVTDHTIFALCKDELDTIEADVISLFAELAGSNKSKIEMLLVRLEAHITQFESSYENILRVAAREPLVLILLLGSLKNLLQQCQNMSGITP